MHRPHSNLLSFGSLGREPEASKTTCANNVVSQLSVVPLQVPSGPLIPNKIKAIQSDQKLKPDGAL